MNDTAVLPGKLDANRLKKNMELFGQILPQVAENMKKADTSGYAFFPTRTGLFNLRREDAYYHSNYDPIRDAETWFSLLDLSQTEVLFVYGVGLGYYHDAAREWLQQDANRYLVFLEDDVVVLKCLLETMKGTEILKDRQVQIHYFDRIEDSAPMVDWLCWYFIQQQLEVSALTHYSQHKGKVFAELRRRLLHEAVLKNAMIAEYMRHGTSFFHNFYANTLAISGSYRGNALFGKFPNIPAIICGAGPSLNKNFDLLKTLGDRALIFAGSSSVNALTNQSLIPHFGAGIDPNPPQLSRLMNNQAHEVPFFYRGRMFHPAFQAIHGPRLHITGTGGYPVSDWFEEKLGIQGDNVEEGHNVITFLMEIAKFMGCDPIILVGMDLAYTDMCAYAGGVVEQAEIRKEDILDSRDMDSNAFLRPDINGKPVYTLWKWISESQWIGEFAKQNPNNTVLNASQGGLGFPGVRNLSLAEVKENFLKNSYDLKGRVANEIVQAEMKDVSFDKVGKLVHELHGSLQRCLKKYDDILKDIGVRQKTPSPVDETMETLMQPVKSHVDALKKECGYRYVLQVFDEVYTKVLNRQVHQIKHDKNLESAMQRNGQRMQLQTSRFRFMKDTASSNIAILEHVTEEYRRQGYVLPPCQGRESHGSAR